MAAGVGAGRLHSRLALGNDLRKAEEATGRNRKRSRCADRTALSSTTPTHQERRSQSTLQLDK
jgi:hypothetical protein